MICVRVARVFWVLSLVLSLPFISPAFAGGFKTIDVPFSGSSGTVAAGINAQGDIVGQYSDSVGSVHGFLLRDGTFTPIDMPEANFTGALGINERGDIVGDYTDRQQVRHGYLLSHGS